MGISKWLRNNTSSLQGKTVAISGSTGGIGKELCRYLLRLEASLVLIDRNREKSDALKKELEKDFANAKISQIQADLGDIVSVKRACDKLEKEPIYALILNAGAYSVPRYKCSTGFDNVFQINFLAPYYMARRLAEKAKIIAVGSIAHNYSRTDKNDVDFSTRKKASLVYGNAKRYLMYSISDISPNVAVTHPGITLTGITDHYPKVIYAIIKNPMKVIFMKPKKACLSILYGLFCETEKGTWIGPRLFDIWGYPKKKRLNTAKKEEVEYIIKIARELYEKIDEI